MNILRIEKYIIDPLEYWVKQGNALELLNNIGRSWDDVVSRVGKNGF